MDEFTLIIIAFVILFIILCLTVAFLLYVLGVTKPIDVKAGPPLMKNAVVAYKFAKGPYKYAGKFFTEAALLCPDQKCIGIYYDNPNEIPADKLRYAVGTILSEGIVKPDPELESKMLSEGYKIIRLPEVAHCVMSSFPYVNTVSIMIAVWRVYPKLTQYIKTHKLSAYPMLEIYEPDAIQFMAPLSQQEKFFVAEALECVPDEYIDDLDGDQSLLSSSTRSSPCQSERSSRSASTTFSRSYVSSRFGDDTYTTDEDDESDFESSINVTNDINDEIQDNEISSSIEVRASKACTNLLEDDIQVETEDNIAEDVTGGVDVTTGETSGVAEGVESSLHDSGICSGRASVNANETGSMNEVPVPAEGDGNDSSSSFEEINMETVKAETAAVEAVIKNEL